MARTLELDTITEPGNSGTANITLSSDTTTTMPKVDINSGAIDNTTLGASTPSSVAATTISTTGNATIGATNGNQTLDVASHDLVDGGLKLGGTLVTASANEINALDGILATTTELNLTDGGSSIGTTAVSDGHGILMNHGGTMAQTTVQTLAAYLDDEITSMPNLVGVGTVTSGTWSADTIAVNKGGTGTTTSTGSGSVVLSNSPTFSGTVSGVSKSHVGLGNVDNTADASQVSVGALNSDSITSGFGTINNGSSTITTSGALTAGSFNGYQINTTGGVKIASSVPYTWAGSENVGFGGGDMMGYNRYGSYNTAVGWHAMRSAGWSDNAGGSNNTCVGYKSGYNMTSLSSGDHAKNNIMIGYQSGMTGSPSGSVTTGSGVLCLGDNSITAFYCADDSISTSDGRDKTDIENFTAGLDWIESMRPVTFRWDKRSWYETLDEETGEVLSSPDPDGTHKEEKRHLGFIGQEVLEIEKAHGFANSKNDMLTVNLNEDDTAYGMKYARLVPVLVNAIKELSAKVKALEAA